MNAKTDPAASDESAATHSDTSAPSAASSHNAAHLVPPPTNPHFALFVATAGGLGYFPKAPGTWGSLAGVAIAFVLLHFWQIVLVPIVYLFGQRPTGSGFVGEPFVTGGYPINPNLIPSVFGLLFAAAIGVWASELVSQRFHEKDPQYIVIDEVSGQHLALLLGCLLPVSASRPGLIWMGTPPGLHLWPNLLNWKYLLVGFILFRVFDIWKPFPARQAESLPGGWGIMADDWIAGIYAAIALWLARAAGL
jgi:phosphatidylglycerophosphatase A